MKIFVNVKKRSDIPLQSNMYLKSPYTSVFLEKTLWENIWNPNDINIYLFRTSRQTKEVR